MEARVGAGLNRAQLGRRCGVTRAAASAWELSSPPGLEMLLMIAKATEVSLAFLLKDLF